MGGKKKKQVVEEEQLKPKGTQITQLMDKSDMDKTQFLSLMPSDAIYFDKITVLKYQAFSSDQKVSNDQKKLKDEKKQKEAHQKTLKDLTICMRQILKQLNWLRYLSFKQFWATVQFNLSLKYCLQSCLLFLQRKKYNQYLHQQETQSQNQDETKEDPQNFQSKIKEHEVLEYQKHIYSILLVIYFRIINAAEENLQLSKQFKCDQFIYDNWVFDIPKLFNFMDIYGQSNPEITKVFVEKIFQLNSNFKLDYVDVLGMMSRHIFPDIFSQFKFLHDRSEFEKQLNQDTLKRQIKHLMIIKDVTSSFVNVFEFFPLDVKIYIITSLVLTPLENIYYETYTAYKNWQYKHLKQTVHSLMDSIQEDIINIWVNIFKLIQQITLQEKDMRNILDFYQLRQLTIQNLNRLDQFGTVISQGKKGKGSRNYMLLQRIMQDFDFEQFVTQVLSLQDKIINHVRIQQFLIVIKKLNEVKNRRLHPELYVQKSSSQQQVQKQILDQIKPNKKQDNIIPQVIPVRKQSSHLSSQKKQQKQDNITSRMQKIRKPKRVQKTNQRQYEDEYDDFYDYNRKIEENNNNSDSQIQQIPQNHNRFFNHKNNNDKQGQKQEGGKFQNKNNKYIEKKISKQYQKPQKHGHKDSYRGEDNRKRGGLKGDFKPAKKQYRQK